VLQFYPAPTVGIVAMVTGSHEDDCSDHKLYSRPKRKKLTHAEIITDIKKQNNNNKTTTTSAENKF